MRGKYQVANLEYHVLGIKYINGQLSGINYGVLHTVYQISRDIKYWGSNSGYKISGIKYRV